MRKIILILVGLIGYISLFSQLDITKRNVTVTQNFHVRGDSVLNAGEVITTKVDSSVIADTSEYSKTIQGKDTVWIKSLSSGSYTLPTMSTTVKGGAKVGYGHIMNGDSINVDTSKIGKKYYSGAHIRIDGNNKVNLGDSATSDATTINIDGSIADNDLFTLGGTNPFLSTSITSSSIDLIQKSSGKTYGNVILGIDGVIMKGYSPTRSKTFEIHADSSQCAILRTTAANDSVPLKFINNSTTSAVIWAKGNELYFKNNSGTSKTLTELASGASIDTTKTPLIGHYATQYDLSLKQNVLTKPVTTPNDGVSGFIPHYATSTTIDSTKLFYNPASRRFSFGGINPGSQVEIVSETSALTRGLDIVQNSPGGYASLHFKKSRGTNASPTAITNGEYIGIFFGMPYTGTGYIYTSSFGYIVNGTVTPTSIPTDFFISTGASNDPGITNTRLYINSSGYTGFGGTLTPKFTLDVNGSTRIIGANSLILGGTSTSDADYVFSTVNTSNVIENYPRADLNTSWTLKNAAKTTTLLNADFTNKTVTIGDTLKAPIVKSSIAQLKLVDNLNKMNMKLDQTKFSFYYNADSLFRIKSDTVYSHKVFKPISVWSTGSVNASYFQMLYGGMSTTLQTTASGLGITNNVGTAFPITMSSGGYGSAILKSGLTTTNVFQINRAFDANNNTVTGYLIDVVDNPTNVNGTIGGGVIKAQVGTMTKIVDLNPRATYNLYTFGSYRDLTDSTTIYRIKDSATVVLKVDAKGYIHNDNPHAVSQFMDSSIVIALTQNVWVQITGATKQTWPTTEYVGFTDNGDTIISAYSGDFNLAYEVNLLGVSSKDYEYRMMKKRGATTTTIWSYKITSSGNAVLRSIRSYLEDVLPNDRYWIELRSTSVSPGNTTIYGGRMICTTQHLD
jgi:hypothetical protein